MERKVASDYPQELLDLFHEYQHGDISRRTFLERAGKYAIGGMTALALLESLTPDFARAEQVPPTDARIKTQYMVYPSPKGSGTMRGYLAVPANIKGKAPPRARNSRLFIKTLHFPGRTPVI